MIVREKERPRVRKIERDRTQGHGLIGQHKSEFTEPNTLQIESQEMYNRIWPLVFAGKRGFMNKGEGEKWRKEKRRGRKEGREEE